MVSYDKIQREYNTEYVDYVYELLKSKESLQNTVRELDKLSDIMDDYESGWEIGALEMMILHIRFLADRYKK